MQIVNVRCIGNVWKCGLLFNSDSAVVELDCIPLEAPLHCPLRMEDSRSCQKHQHHPELSPHLEKHKECVLVYAWTFIQIHPNSSLWVLELRQTSLPPSPGTSSLTCQKLQGYAKVGHQQGTWPKWDTPGVPKSWQKDGHVGDAGAVA